MKKETAEATQTPSKDQDASRPDDLLQELERISRDEMHLATYPIALLTYQGDKSAVIVQTRQRRHPLTKKLVQATWRVEGGAELGLPTATDDAVVLVLLEITREAGWTQDIYFTRADVIDRLGWPDNKTSYDKLDLALRRLQAVTITSKNVFWDETAKAFVSTGFHLIDSFEIVEKRGRKRRVQGNVSEERALELALSRVQWSDVMWRSFKDGNLKPVSLSLYFSLRLPLARRLYRFLDLKKYDGKAVFKIGLRKLCEEYLGIAKSKYPSIYKKSLKPAHDELIANGFLESAEFEEAKSDSQNVVYVFKMPASLEAAEQDGEQLSGTGPQLPSEIAKTKAEACDAVLERLKKEDPEEYERIHLEAKEMLGDIHCAMLARDPDAPAVRHTIEDNMRNIVAFDFRWEVEEYMGAL